MEMEGKTTVHRPEDIALPRPRDPTLRPACGSASVSARPQEFPPGIEKANAIVNVIAQPVGEWTTTIVTSTGHALAAIGIETWTMQRTIDTAGTIGRRKPVASGDVHLKLAMHGHHLVTTM